MQSPYLVLLLCSLVLWCCGGSAETAYTAVKEVPSLFLLTLVFVVAFAQKLKVFSSRSTLAM